MNSLPNGTTNKNADPSMQSLNADPSQSSKQLNAPQQPVQAVPIQAVPPFPYATAPPFMNPYMMNMMPLAVPATSATFISAAPTSQAAQGQPPPTLAAPPQQQQQPTPIPVQTVANFDMVNKVVSEYFRDINFPTTIQAMNMDRARLAAVDLAQFHGPVVRLVAAILSLAPSLGVFAPSPAPYQPFFPVPPQTSAPSTLPANTKTTQKRKRADENEGTTSTRTIGVDTRSPPKLSKTENDKKSPTSNEQPIIADKSQTEDTNEQEITLSSFEMHQVINEFIKERREMVDKSNIEEFIAKSDSDPKPNTSQSADTPTTKPNDEIDITTNSPPSKSARTHMLKVDRNVQMKSSIVKNITGPLERSVRSLHGHEDEIQTVNGVEERLSNLYKYLGVSVVTPIPLTIYERVKIIEDKIMDLEKELPDWCRSRFRQPNRKYTANNPPPPTTMVSKTRDNRMLFKVIPGTYYSMENDADEFQGGTEKKMDDERSLEDRIEMLKNKLLRK